MDSWCDWSLSSEGVSVCLCKAMRASSCNLSGAVEGMCVNNSANQAVLCCYLLIFLFFLLYASSVSSAIFFPNKAVLESLHVFRPSRLFS